ncbi:DNA-processing protein DprA [Paenarthrobacter sp. CC6]|uniref:DNA-processing protein DprA n=1 Tax=unclassified Paenarthrobacter TaxID=2634190 RepID=UPI00084E5755|nr:DNA-processing protein DprA [Paenarthrobacter sp. R1]OEH62130.1 DNA processing protein DprA [Arthrobacter sp. D4]OEH63575.1 DNA processing protein DprA [Arthrobacter sp. D2]WIV29283.1 DNA-processing protein DprA [Paenarthrobacter sp. R1]
MNDRIARAALTRLFDPQDVTGRTLVGTLGAYAALRVATGDQPAHTFRHITDVDLTEALNRWAPRLPDVDPERDLAEIEHLGGGFLIPGDEHWPTGLDDLPDAPYGLWYRGNITHGIPAPERSVALTGSRDSTSYGAAVTGDIAHQLAQRGICVISGLGYGIDAHAHRAALAGFSGDGAATIAVAAGGLDRDYPSGNADLAAAIRANGLTVSEQPPSTAPTRYRFLQRGRIIAALAGVTCVVEARWRSGALHTAHQAETIARHVAAVPGSVHSANSAGCHRLLRDGGAILVTDAAEISELLAA